MPRFTSFEPHATAMRHGAHAMFVAVLIALAGAPVQAQTSRPLQHFGQKQLAPLPPGVQRIANVPYGDDPKQRMDVYLPQAVQAGTARNSTVGGARSPVIFMVHGGGWRRGDKALANTVQEKVARWVPKGFVLISTNYRMLPEAAVDQQLNDVSLALKTAQQRAAQWGADAGKFILMGHSAGAHLVALRNARAAAALTEGAWPWLGAVVLDSGVLNVPAYMSAPHVPLYDDAFGRDPAYWLAMSPYHQWAPGAPPMQMVCSVQRQDNPCLQADNMARHVLALGGRAQVLPQDLSHGEINAELGLESEYTRSVEVFMSSLDPLVAQRLRR